MAAESAIEVGQAFRALSDPNRRLILRIVRDGERSVGDIAASAGLSQQITSHHLRVLQGAGLVQGSRSGTRHLFAVRTDGLAAARAYLDDFWPKRLSALKDAVEAAERVDNA